MFAFPLALAFVLGIVLEIMHAYLFVLSVELAPIMHVSLFVLVTIFVVAFEILFVNVIMFTYVASFETFV